MSVRSAPCDRARNWVSLRLDGALSELESAMLDRHLAGCAECRRFDADVAASTARLRAAPLETPVARFGLPARSRRGRLVALQGVGTMAAALAAALTLVSGGSRPTPPAEGGAAPSGPALAVAAAPRSPDNTLGVHQAPVVRTLVHSDDTAIHGAFGLSS